MTRWIMPAGAALLVTACGDGAKRSPAPAATTVFESRPMPPDKPPNDAEQLDQLLAARAKALELEDAQDFVKTATGAQATKDRRAIAAAKALPIGTVQLTAKGTEVEGDRATLRVQMVYTFDDVDTHYFKTSRMTARKTPDGWRVSNDWPSSGTLAPWEYARYTARTSKHFLALAPKSLKVGSLMGDLEKGRTRMKRGLPGVKPPERMLVIVAGSGKDTRALTKNIRTLSALTAIAETQYSVQGPARRVAALWGERVFVMWPSYSGRPASERQMVVAHEITHAALARPPAARPPPWLYEGIAMYVSGDNRAGEAGALISGHGILKDGSKQGAADRAMSLTRLSNVRALQRMSPVSLSFAYSYSSAAAYMIAEKYGRKALLRLFSAYNSEKVRGKPGRKLTDTVLRRTLKKSLKQFESEVRAYASAHSRF